MKRFLITIHLMLMATLGCWAQDTLLFTLSQAIDWAQRHAPSAVAAQHTLQSAYWNFRAYQASYKPAVSLSTSPTFNRGIERVVQPDGTNSFVHVSQLSTDAAIEVSQNIPLTGGNLFMKSSLLRDDQIEGSKMTAFRSQPISIGYQQNLIGYNEMRWNRRIEPLKWQEAQKQYNETMELVASQASQYFFDLATAQTNVDIARSNLASADTLCRYAKGRYNIGTITENEMLQLELNQLREETNLLDADVEMKQAAEALRNFLNLPTGTALVVMPDSHVPTLEIPLDEALELALQNSPDPDYYMRQQQEARQNLAYARASTRLKADLYLQFGLSQTGETFHEAYRSPTDMQYASLSLSVPILDWGRGKGKRRVAQSNVDLADLRAEQGMKSFEQNVMKMVQQFNLQSRRVAVANQASQTAKRRYEVARRLYVLGKNTILDLNSAISEKDAARRSFIQSLSTYWTLYYGLRSMTGFDFEKRMPINWNKI
ncbi:MAG: TolC family protein [Bacteroidales bacterium]|nr:TolC family protein [Bacteroidales bacterium]